MVPSFKVMLYRVAQCDYWNVNCITFQWFTIGLLVNIPRVYTALHVYEASV